MFIIMWDSFILRFYSIHFIVTLDRLKDIVRYIEDFVSRGSLNHGSTVVLFDIL